MGVEGVRGWFGGVARMEYEKRARQDRTRRCGYCRVGFKPGEMIRWSPELKGAHVECAQAAVDGRVT